MKNHFTKLALFLALSLTALAACSKGNTTATPVVGTTPAADPSSCDREGKGLKACTRHTDCNEDQICTNDPCGTGIGTMYTKGCITGDRSKLSFG